MKVDNFVFNRLMNYIQYISTTTQPPRVIIPDYAPGWGHAQNETAPYKSGTKNIFKTDRTELRTTQQTWQNGQVGSINLQVKRVMS